MRASQMMLFDALPRRDDWRSSCRTAPASDSRRGTRIEKQTGADRLALPGRAVLHREDARASASGRACRSLTDVARSSDRTRAQTGSTPSRFAAERGSAWTLMYPELLGRGAGARPGESAARLSDWPAGSGVCDLHEHLDRTEEKGRHRRSLYRYWMLGQDAAPRQPRWSIIRDVLHWSRTEVPEGDSRRTRAEWQQQIHDPVGARSFSRDLRRRARRRGPHGAPAGRRTSS